MSNTQYIDLSLLSTTVGGASEIIKQTILMFLENAPKDMETMNAALAGEDFKKLRDTAHKHKSSAAYMGIHPVVSACETLQNIYETNGDFSRFPDLVKTIIEGTEHAIPELQEAMNNL
ncbi:Hpt domain-containing protein [Pontibacter sp. G13]|uniref:Hpt domain-containing protein n=1 Tax=Pontibacter sp. G13 TaxID=3074898 RepID=UPI00288BE0FB|nr:Hpt domain-containing protein [Pontibacter sp. G13]WNJ21037.1 Hpt domain-containing protein [Pontibacter sp. G13]